MKTHKEFAAATDDKSHIKEHLPLQEYCPHAPDVVLECQMSSQFTLQQLRG